MRSRRRSYLPAACAATGRRVRAVGSRVGLGCLRPGHHRRRDGDHYLLNGRKLWINNAAEAGLFVLFANADPAAGYRGITAFLIERDFPGFRVGKKEDKLGIRASSTCELILDNCRVPEENVLGEPAKATKSPWKR